MTCVTFAYTMRRCHAKSQRFSSSLSSRAPGIYSLAVSPFQASWHIYPPCSPFPLNPLSTALCKSRFPTGNLCSQPSDGMFSWERLHSSHVCVEGLWGQLPGCEDCHCQLCDFGWFALPLCTSVSSFVK